MEAKEGGDHHHSGQFALLFWIFSCEGKGKKTNHEHKAWHKSDTHPLWSLQLPSHSSSFLYFLSWLHTLSVSPFLPWGLMLMPLRVSCPNFFVLRHPLPTHYALSKPVYHLVCSSQHTEDTFLQEFFILYLKSFLTIW